MQMAANFGPAPSRARANQQLADLPTDRLVRPAAQSFINMSQEKEEGRGGDEVRNTFSFLHSP